MSRDSTNDVRGFKIPPTLQCITSLEHDTLKHYILPTTITSSPTSCPTDATASVTISMQPAPTTRNTSEIIAALLGHSHRAPAPTTTIATLDKIFDDIIINLRSALPRLDLEAGTAALSTILNALDGTPVKRPARRKRYHQPTPSTHCHLCCRASTVVNMAVCGNIREGTCRKVVCERCVTGNGWNWQEVTDGRWICPHCTDACAGIDRAHCWVYTRTNSRRKRNGIRKRQGDGIRARERDLNDG